MKLSINNVQNQTNSTQVNWRQSFHIWNWIQWLHGLPMQWPWGRSMQRWLQGMPLSNIFVSKILVWRSLIAIAQELLPFTKYKNTRRALIYCSGMPPSNVLSERSPVMSLKDGTLLPKHIHACPTRGLQGIPYWSLPLPQRQRLCHSL